LFILRRPDKAALAAAAAESQAKRDAAAAGARKRRGGASAARGAAVATDEAQLDPVNQASELVPMDEYLSRSAATPSQMLENALRVSNGDLVRPEALFGSPPAVDTNRVGHVPQKESFPSFYIAEMLRIVNLRRSALPQMEVVRETPRLLSAVDMLHYVVAAVPRPSPLNEHIMLKPLPCVMGPACSATRYFERMLEGFTVPFALPGMLSEAEMCAFYRSGEWPTATPEHACVVCHVLVAQRTAAIINNMSATARPCTVQFQSVRHDTHPTQGFKAVALDEPGPDGSVLEYPMLRLCAPCARISTWHGVPYIDFSRCMNVPRPFANEATWSSDLAAAASAAAASAALSKNAAGARA
jgi:hypothetical protein